jgi:hypothetical protein
MECQAYKVTRPVTKAYYNRINQKPFGIGSGFEDLKTNSVISTIQRENVWHPFYEINVEEMDFKEKLISAAEEKKLKSLGGAEIIELQKQLNIHE